METVQNQSWPAPLGEEESTDDLRVVLVAEDDNELRCTLMRLLEALGYVAIGVARGDELLAWVEPLFLLESRGCAPDLILTDLLMPGIAPLDIVEGLAQVGGPDVPVIVVSGVRDPSTRERVDDVGYLWIDKPIIPTQLEAAVVRVLAERRRRRDRDRDPDAVPH